MARVLHACLLLVVATSADDEWSSHTKCAPPAVTWSRVDSFSTSDTKQRSYLAHTVSTN